MPQVAEGSGVADSSGVRDDPVYPMDVLLGLNPANGQLKISGRCGAPEMSACTTADAPPSDVDGKVYVALVL